MPVSVWLHGYLHLVSGMPEDPSVAETYYSQFDEFEEDKDTSHDSSDPNIEVIHGEDDESDKVGAGALAVGP